MRKFLEFCLVASVCWYGITTGCPAFGQSVQVNRRQGEQRQRVKPERKPGTQQGQAIDWDALLHKYVSNDYIVHTYPGDISSVYGEYQWHEPTGFKKKQAPKKSNVHRPRPKGYSNPNNWYDENGKHIHNNIWE